MLLYKYILFLQAAPNVRTWLAEVSGGDSTASICGLQISFSSVPQDIDIKVIPGQSNDTQGEQGLPSFTFLILSLSGITEKVVSDKKTRK